MAERDHRVRCELALRFPSEDCAAKVFHAVDQDNCGYVEARQEEETIHAKIEAATLRSLLHTLDDFMSCVSVAEKIVSKKQS
jgi:tRNA threonylcarbamoyladenosine modification (KEOPS) complex  Pcc1 subunit